jgi:ribosomal protein S18 acetylase RimI-like enzyme
VTIRKLLAEDAAVFQELRLRALLDKPGSFTSSHAEESPLSLGEVAERLAPTADRAVFGAFDAGRMIGMAGIGRESMVKIAHKAYVWGMYVEPSYRGKGWGQRLLDAAIEFAAEVPGIRQVNISVYSGNDVARRMYISSGFVPYGVEACAMQVGDTCYDEEHMVRLLARPTR